jgi:hypothetical protein
MIEVDLTVDFIEKHQPIGNPNSCKPAFVIQCLQYWQSFGKNRERTQSNQRFKKLFAAGSTSGCKKPIEPLDGVGWNHGNHNPNSKLDQKPVLFIT